LRDEDSYVEWLQECTDIQRAELVRSNFYEVTGEVYSDIPTFGVASIQCDKRTDRRGKYSGLNWESIWLKEIVALANEYGDLDTTFRCYEQSALQWVDMFGKESGGKLEQLAASKPEEKVKFLHAVYPRNAEDVDWVNVDKGLADPLKMPVASVWVNLLDKKITRESGFHENPRHMVRWAKLSGSIWANSPGMLALPDIRTLNEAKRLEMIAWEKAIDRPMKTTQNNLIDNRLNLGAGGLTLCRDVNALQPLFDGTDFNLTAVKTDELRTSILRTFFADLIREPGQDTGAKTAYEVAKRIERAQRILGEAVGHLRGMLNWAGERSFRIMFREGRFPPPPEGLLEASPQIDVRNTSPLQSAQESQGIEQTMMFLGEMSQLAQVQVSVGREPDVLDWVDWDGIVKNAARSRSVPATGLKSQVQVRKVRDERDAQKAKAQAQQDALQGAAVVKGVGQGAGPEQAQQVLRSMSG
jgi:hypothetical protein